MSRLTVRSAYSDEVKQVGHAHLIDKPGFLPELCKVGLLGESVTSFCIAERAILSYGTARIRVFSMLDLYTQPEHRAHGFADEVARAALATATERGAHLALTYDKTDGYYERFGFSSVIPNYRLALSAAKAASLPSDRVHLRDARAGDALDMAALYNRMAAGRTTMLRSPKQWLWFVRQATQGVALVAVNDEEEVEGYVVAADIFDEYAEVVAATFEAAAAIIRYVAQRFVTAGRETIRWQTSPDDALVYFARQATDTTVSAEYSLAGGWVGRVINARSFVGAVLEELRAQAAIAGLDFAPESLRMACHPDHIALAVDGRPDYACRLSHRDFIQILFGALTPAHRALIGLNSQSVFLLSALFPPRGAYLPGRPQAPRG